MSRTLDEKTISDCFFRSIYSGNYNPKTSSFRMADGGDCLEIDSAIRIN